MVSDRLLVFVVVRRDDCLETTGSIITADESTETGLENRYFRKCSAERSTHIGWPVERSKKSVGEHQRTSLVDLSQSALKIVQAALRGHLNRRTTIGTPTGFDEPMRPTRDLDYRDRTPASFNGSKQSLLHDQSPYTDDEISFHV